MSKELEEIKNSIEKLTDVQLQEFRAWFEIFDSEAWDKQIEKDISEGNFDAFAEKAFVEHKAGKSKKL